MNAHKDASPFRFAWLSLALLLTVVAGSGTLAQAQPKSDAANLTQSMSGTPVYAPWAYAFEDSGITSLVQVDLSSATWGDYDKDGDLDILVTGGYNAKVYRNDGANTFTDIGAGLTGVNFSAAAWGDYDKDGDLDILLTGAVTGYPNFDPVTKIYRNDGGTFTDIAAPLPNVRSGSVAWGDYDNDGDLDILLSGHSTSGRITGVYRNDGNGSFTDIGSNLERVEYSSGAWGDYDNDGDLDILLTGTSNSSYSTALYRNDGGTFVTVDVGLTQVANGSVAWGDYDDDGDLDILLTGQGGGNLSHIAQIYRNNDDGTFTDIGAGLRGVYDSSVAWGDYDNDGDLDILLSGFNDDSAPITRVYRNDSGDVFTDISAGLIDVEAGSVAWGDFDNDTDLDILLTGNRHWAPVTKIYRNTTIITNDAPAVPTGLTASVAETSAILSWNAVSDDYTPSAGLTYNVRVGTTSGGADVVAPQSLTATGYRQVPALGNVFQITTTQLKGLTLGKTYYWSVQAVDTALAGSPFALEASFVPRRPPLALSPGYNQTVFPGTVVTYTHILTNSSDITDTYQVQATNSLGWTIALASTDWPTATLTLPVIEVTPATTRTFVVRVAVPGTAIAGISASTSITTVSQAAPTIHVSIADTTVAKPLARSLALSPGYSQTAASGAVINYIHILTNTSNMTDTFQVRAINSLGWPITIASNGWYTSAPVLPLIDVSPYTTRTFVIGLAVPDGTLDGISSQTYITASVSTASVSITDTTVVESNYKLSYIYLPLIARRWPPVPDAPVLNSISNPYGIGSYQVTWGLAYLADTYTLQEDTSAAFSNPLTRYSGYGTSWSASNQAVGTYYYRVKASNSWGDSGWSNVQSVVVPPRPYEGNWLGTTSQGKPISFKVSGNSIIEIIVYYKVGACNVSFQCGGFGCGQITGNTFSYSDTGEYGSTSVQGTFASNSKSSGTTQTTIAGCGSVNVNWNAKKQ
jgi:hypothetical protein